MALNTNPVILTIDDEKTIRDSFRNYLEDFDYTVLEAENGRVGLEIFAEAKPDLVLVDLRMPQVDGLEVLSNVTKSSPDTPIIVISGTGIIADAVEALRLGAWDYLLKPIEDMSILVHAIRKALERARLVRENKAYQEHLEDEVARRTEELQHTNAELKQVNRRLRKIVETTRDLSAYSNFKNARQLGPRLLKEFGQQMNAEGGSMYLLEEEGLRLVHTLDPGHAPDFVPYPLPENSVMNKLITTGQPLLINNFKDNEYSPSGWEGYADGSSLGFPLPSKDGSIIGILMLHSKVSPPFIPQDMEIGSILASFSCEALRAAQATEALIESVQKYQLLAENLKDVVMAMSPEGVITYCSPAIKDFGGYPPEASLGHKINEFFAHEDDIKRAFAAIGKMKSDLTPAAMEFLYKPRDREPFYVEVSAKPIVKDGELVTIQCVMRDISDRKQAEEAIRQSEARYRSLAEHSPDTIMRLDRNHRHLYVNPTVEKFIGIKPEEFIGKTHEEMGFPKELCHFWETQITQVFETGQPVETDFKFEQNNEAMYLDWRLYPEFDDNGEIISILAISRDITEHTLAVEALRRSEEKYRTFIETTSEGYWLIGPNAETLDVNQALCNMLGYDRHEMLGKTLYDFVDEKNAEIFRYQTGKIYHMPHRSYEIALRTKAGENVYTYFNATTLTDGEGNPRGSFALISDFTERKQAEMILHRQSEALEQSLDGIAIITLEGDLIFANKAWAAMHGYASDELQGKHHSVFHTAEQLTDEVLPFIESTKESGGSIREIGHVKKDGTVFPTRMSTSLLRDNTGQVIGLIEIAHDITEELRLESQLRQSQKMEAIGQLAGGVAHDFNNLLTAIMGNAQLLSMKLSDGTEEASFSRQIIQASGRAADLTRQLLAFSRKGKLQTVDVDSHQTIAEVVKLLVHSIDRRIQIREVLQAESSIVRGDPTQLQNAILNLGVNARDAMPDGGELTFQTRNVTIDEDYCSRHAYDVQPGSYLEIAVSDTGVGIAQDIQKHIFEPFFTTKKQGQGTGLGLASVYGAIKNHHGSINLYSEVNVGTTFKILLPTASSTVSSVPQKTGEIVRGQGRVLIVDDEEIVRGFAAKALGDLGYDTHACADGFEATEYYQQHYQEIDLIILDLIMPRMGGKETFHQLRKINPEATIIISSGFTQNNTTTQLMDAGAVAFLSKPFHMDELSQKVAKYIRKT